MRAAHWRLVLRRSRSEWLMVVAAWLVVLAAASLISAGVMYSDAVARSGLLRVLADAGPTEVNIQVRARVDRGTAAAADARVVEELTRTLDGLTAPIVRSGRSESFALPGQVTGEVTDLAVFGSAEGIEDHATLRAGAWPVAGQAPVQVALSEPVASRLHLAPGDELTLLSRLDPALSIAVRVAGVYRVADPADPFWWGDQLALEGVAEGRSFTVFGPLMVAREDLLTRTLVHRVELSWRTFPTLDQIEPQALTSLRARVGALPDRLDAALDGSETVQVDTGLGPLLDRASASLLVSGTGVLLLNVQLAILAGYALLLVAGLIVEQRRAESALLRSRGASTGNLAWFALLEGLVMVVPAAILGPLLAVGLLHAFNVVGPLAGSGVRLEPRLGESAVLSSAVAATAALFGLVVPAVISAGPLAGIRRSFGRQVGRTFAHRMGLDIALVALAVIGLWQLNRYGAPLTRSLRGTLGADPLLVAAPAIGLLAGAVLALRLVPLLGRALEELLAHRRGLVSSLGARQLARRPLRYTRSALLLMVASAIGFFAGAYSATWGESQRDQVDYEVAADVRVISPGSAESPMWNLAGAYAQLPAGAESLPVLKDSFDLGQFGGRGTLVALDSSRASAVVAFRSDLADVPLGELMGRLDAGRPNVDLASLPGFPARLGLDLEVGLEALLTDEYPGRIPSGGSGASVAAIVRDAAGLIHRFAGDTADLRDGAGRVVVPLETPAEEATARTLAYPLELLAIEAVLRV
ncbi:MAG: hypothetical protein H0V12_04530, partial [Chloroflexi bacterium]|nr:hypothetical protein [Chloroflexota bacterium]